MKNIKKLINVKREKKEFAKKVHKMFLFVCLDNEIKIGDGDLS